VDDETQQFADEIKRHFDVSAEALRSEIRQVVEGFRRLDEKVTRSFEEVAREFDEVKAMIKFSPRRCT
jgi:hypothetical protein